MHQLFNSNRDLRGKFNSMGELLTYAQDTFNADEVNPLQWLEDNGWHVHNGTEELF